MKSGELSLASVTWILLLSVGVLAVVLGLAKRLGRLVFLVIGGFRPLVVLLVLGPVRWVLPGSALARSVSVLNLWR